MITEIYADGGVILKNPSPIGGTYAIRLIHDDGQIEQHSGVLLPKHGYREVVSNNVSELAAVLAGLRYVPDDWKGVVYSDSWVTLQRVFHGAKCNNVPRWLMDRLEMQVNRLRLGTRITYVLLDGHPTKAQLAEGIGKRGNMVSEHNVWCDQECGRVAKKYLQEQENKHVQI